MSEEMIVSLDCAGCGNEIGRLVEVKGQDYLHLGGLIGREAHGVCAQCGKVFHWSVPDNKLGGMLEYDAGRE